MSLIFGRLVNDFLNFQRSVAAVQANDTPEAEASLAVTAAQFRHSAATDATYLVYIGDSVIHVPW